MARTKATVRRLGRPTFVLAPGKRNSNKNILSTRLGNAPSKLKKTATTNKTIRG